MTQFLALLDRAKAWQGSSDQVEIIIHAISFTLGTVKCLLHCLKHLTDLTWGKTGNWLYWSLTHVLSEKYAARWQWRWAECSNAGWKYTFSLHQAHNLFPLVSSDFYEKSLKQKVSSGAIMSCTNLIPYYHKLSATHA